MKGSTRTKIDRAARALRELAEHVEEACEPDGGEFAAAVDRLHDQLHEAEREFESAQMKAARS